MRRIIPILRNCIEPVGGAIFIVLWIIAESGRQDVGIVAVCGFGLAISVSHLLPRISLGITGVVIIAQAVHLVSGPHSTDWPTYMVIPIVVGIVATVREPRLRWVALCFGAVASLGAVALMVFQADGWTSWIGQSQYMRLQYEAGEYIELAAVAVVITTLAWGTGFAVTASTRLIVSQQNTLKVTQQLAQSEVELAVAQLRNRIAQEMHDVLAHSLAVVIAQADGARYLRPSRPAAVDGALKTIADSARLALGDMRSVIDGILDGTELPQPGLDEIDALVGGMASTGMTVSLRDAGERGRLADGQQLALYRIVQEGLTNALRHRGRDCAVTIVLDWRGPGVSVLIESSGGELQGQRLAEADHEPRREGRGIIGMRERAHLAGGWLTVGVEEDGTHRLTAFIPFYPTPAAVAVSVMAA
jgi:signal transduction histidine kinase